VRTTHFSVGVKSSNDIKDIWRTLLTRNYPSLPRALLTVYTKVRLAMRCQIRAGLEAMGENRVVLNTDLNMIKNGRDDTVK
jgi:hypothetical protein